MPTVPESDLQNILKKLIDASDPNTNARKTAVRWFNRLYYDVRRWNESFISFLRTYPGFKNSQISTEYEQFIKGLAEYRDSLEERYGMVKGDLCTNLKILSARYPSDFMWLFNKDRELYKKISESINASYATENKIIGIAYSVCAFICDIGMDEHYHMQHHDEIVKRICDYEDASRDAVASLKQMSDSVGIHLLDISEYEAILNHEGSTNPNVMVIGEITMSRDEIHVGNVVGPVNINAQMDTVTQIVKNAPELSELSDLLAELNKSLASSGAKPEDAQRVVDAAKIVATEVSKGNPNKSSLTLATKNLNDAANAIKVVAPTVLNVATKIAKFVIGMF